MLDAKAIEKIGLKYIVDSIKIRSYYGKQLLKDNMNVTIKSFNQDEQSLTKTYDNIEHFIKISDEVELHLLSPLFDNIKDISMHIKAIEDGQVLDTVALYELKIQIIQFNKIGSLLNEFLPMELRLVNLFDLFKVLNPEERITEDFHVYNFYSKHLSAIRSRKSSLEAAYFKETNPEKKQRIRDERADVVLEEANEEYEVRKNLTKRIKEYLHAVKANIINIAEIDVLFAKAHFAMKTNSVRPLLGDCIHLKNARSPYLMKTLEALDEDYQPISINLTKGSTIITGANMGGKSSSVRTLLLNVLMAHLGFYVFCDQATISVCDAVHLIQSDEDNSLHGLSTFGVEVIKLNQTIERLKNDEVHLIIVDEFARSTNPNEGMKFVKTLARFANKYDSFTVLTTHFDDVPEKGMTHYQVKGFIGTDQKFDKNDFRKQISKYMDYSLIEVDYSKVVPKDALNIARLLDLDTDFERDLISLYKEEVNE